MKSDAELERALPGGEAIGIEAGKRLEQMFSGRHCVEADVLRITLLVFQPGSDPVYITTPRTLAPAHAHKQRRSLASTKPTRSILPIANLGVVIKL